MQSTADLVTDTKFRVEFYSDLVHRFTFHSSNTPGQYVRRKEKLDVWKKDKAIGSGSYGSVWLHRCLTSEDQGELQAVKMINKIHLSSGGIDFRKELEAIAKFSQKKYLGLFVEYFGWYENEESIFIVMEYIQHGDLGTHLTTPLPESDAREIIFQIADGLEHLHRNGFVHRDLKPENVFVVTKKPEWWVKIGDFGFSKRIKENSSLRSMVGTRLFLAPEVQMIYPPGVDETSAVFHYSEKVDIWSLGVMAFYILFHQFPFTTNAPYALPQYVRGGPFPFPISPLVQMLSEECCHFMVAAMAPNANMRLSARGVLESKWLKQRAFDCASSIAKLQISRKVSSTIPQVTRTQVTRPRESQKAITPFNDGTASLTPRTPQSNQMSSLLVSPGISLKSANLISSLPGSLSREHHRPRAVPRDDSRGVPGDWLRAVPRDGPRPVLQDEQRYGKAETMSKQSIEEWNIDMLSSLCHRAHAILKPGRYAEAEGYFQFAFDGLIAHGWKNPDTYLCLQGLTYALSAQGKHAEAEGYFRLALGGLKEDLGSQHPNTLLCLHGLGHALYCQNKFAEAESYLQPAFDGFKETLGWQHPNTLSCFNDLAKVYRS